MPRHFSGQSVNRRRSHEHRGQGQGPEQKLLPVAVIATEGIAYESTLTLALLLRHSVPYWLYGGPVAERLVDRFSAVMNMEMLVSMLIGAAFVWLAIRFNRSEEC
jgi:hypothetical protein